MNFLRNRSLAIAILSLVSGAVSYAQDHTGTNTGFTPYSMFGLGQMAPQGTGFNSLKGGEGIADRNVRFINIMNPAAVTAREQKSFMMDVSLRESNILFEASAKASGLQGDGNVRSANNTFNLGSIVMSFPIAKTSAFKVGIMPYSSTGYNFEAIEKSQDLTADAGDIRYVYSGSGGIYQIFLGAGYTFLKRFSIGIDGYYYFGNINHSSSAVYMYTNSIYRGISKGNYYSMSGVGAKAGLQYSQPIGKSREITIGATYSIPTRIKGEKTEYSFGEMSSSTDTIHYATNNIEGYRIPSEMGVGISYKSSDKWTVAFDYRRQNWKNANFDPTPGVDFAPDLAQSFRFGIEWTPARYDVRYYMKTLTYHLGAYYDKSYMSLNGRNVAATGITLGVTFPVFRYYNSISFGVDIGQNGTIDNNMMRERYIRFTLAFSFHDIWFIKQLYE